MKAQSEIIIIKAQKEHIRIIQELSKTIWNDWYPSIISQKQIDYMLKKFYNKETIAKEMDTGIAYWLAKYDNTFVGYASAGCIDETENIVKLHKLYVKTNLHGKGVGAHLLHQAIAFAKQRATKKIILNVNKHNPTVQYYFAKGFTIQKETILDIGDGFVMDDYILQLDL